MNILLFYSRDRIVRATHMVTDRNGNMLMLPWRDDPKRFGIHIAAVVLLNADGHWPVQLF